VIAARYVLVLIVMCREVPGTHTIVPGKTLSGDGHARSVFDYMPSNPLRAARCCWSTSTGVGSNF
jgi:hypothetical protein